MLAEAGGGGGRVGSDSDQVCPPNFLILDVGWGLRRTLDEAETEGERERRREREEKEDEEFNKDEKEEDPLNAPY